MNLVMASVLLLATLAFQPTLIYGSKGLASAAAGNHHSGSGKKHSALTSAARAKLVMSLASGDVLVRAARGAAEPPAVGAAAPAATAADTAIGNGHSVGNFGSTGGAGKRGKNNNNNKRLNKNSTPENAPTHAGRKHLDKKYSAAANQQQQQQHGVNNNKGKQRQLLKSQQHQSHSKRAGGKSRAENGDKSGDGEKSQSTCRYAKSTWTECDVKTNMRSRTLTLKKGEEHCPPTRTMQKKCKKACRYEKGAWSECSNGQMTRQDKLKSTGSDTGGDSSCERVRDINKKCKPAGAAGAGKSGGKAANKERRNKDKASRRAQQQA